MYRSKDVLSAVASSETTALQAAAYPTIPYPGVGKTFNFVRCWITLESFFLQAALSADQKGATSSSTTFPRLVRNLPCDPQLIASSNRSSQTQTSAKHSSLSAPSSQPRSSSTSRQTSQSVSVSLTFTTTDCGCTGCTNWERGANVECCVNLLASSPFISPRIGNHLLFTCRVCLLHHGWECTGGYSGHEWLPSGHKETQGANQET